MIERSAAKHRAIVEALKLDVLVGNAGICPFHAFLDMPLNLMRHTMEVNLFGTFYVAQAAADQMVKQGRGGSIIAVSSISALHRHSLTWHPDYLLGQSSFMPFYGHTAAALKPRS